MATTIEKELTRNPAATKPRFDNLLDDFRLYDGTRDALQAIAGAVEYPAAESTSKAEWSEWWKKMGPIFGDVVGGWVEDTPDDIEGKVSKIDLTQKEVPIRILKSKDLPSSSSSSVPVIVYLHGGGFTAWSFKDKSFDGYLTRLAALGKCVIVAVDYRPAHTNPFPQGLNDCYDVTEFVASGGLKDEHGVPAGPVLVAGDSSGSNLAFGTALKAKREGTVDKLIAGLYYLCPYFAGESKTADFPSMMECDGLFASKGFLDAVLGNVCDDETKKEWFQSPLLWPILATKEDMEGMPPSSTIVMELDMIRDMGVEMHYKLKNSGVESYITIVSGGIHEQQLFSKHSPYVTEQSIHDIAAFASYCCNK